MKYGRTHALIDTISDCDITGGLRLSLTKYTTFTQAGEPERTEVEISVGTPSKPSKRIVTKYVFKGCINTNIGSDNKERAHFYCRHCGRKLVRNGTVTTRLKDVPTGQNYSDMDVQRHRWLCTNKECHYCWTEPMDFKDREHLLTCNLVTYICDLLQTGLTMKDISIMTGVDKNTIKAIDKRRLNELYTVDGKELKKPTEYSEYIGTDEFLLHKGTVILDLKTGHVLHLSHGKKKQHLNARNISS